MDLWLPKAETSMPLPVQGRLPAPNVYVAGAAPLPRQNRKTIALPTVFARTNTVLQCWLGGAGVPSMAVRPDVSSSVCAVDLRANHDSGRRGADALCACFQCAASVKHVILFKNDVSPGPRGENGHTGRSPRAGPSSDLHVNSRCKRLTRQSLHGLGDTSNSIT